WAGNIAESPFTAPTYQNLWKTPMSVARGFRSVLRSIWTRKVRSFPLRVERAREQSFQGLFRRTPTIKHGVDGFDDRHRHAVLLTELVGALRGRIPFGDTSAFFESFREGRPLAEFVTESAVARE